MTRRVPLIMSEPLPMESLQQEEKVTPDVKTDVVERFEKKLRKTKTKTKSRKKKCQMFKIENFLKNKQRGPQGICLNKRASLFSLLSKIKWAKTPLVKLLGKKKLDRM